MCVFFDPPRPLPLLRRLLPARSGSAHGSGTHKDSAHFRIHLCSRSSCFPDTQVFEYLTTDLKRYMDRNGKGPAYPLATQTVKVGCRAPGSWPSALV